VDPEAGAARPLNALDPRIVAGNRAVSLSKGAFGDPSAVRVQEGNLQWTI
jgi:hypothetical protein